MRKTIALLFCTLFFTKLSFGQQPSFVVESTTEKPTKKRSWTLAGESGFTNLFESNNKVELIDGATSYAKAEYQTRLAKRVAFIVSTTGAIQNSSPYHGVFSVSTGLKYQQSLRTSLKLNNEFTFSEHKRFGNLSGNLQYVMGDENKQLTLFTDAHYYYPLESSTRHRIHSGYAGFVGLKGVMEKHPWEGESKIELIADRSSIVPGNRLLVNGDFFIGLRINRLSIGPRIGYWRKLSGNFEHHHAFNYGLAILLK